MTLVPQYAAILRLYFLNIDTVPVGRRVECQFNCCRASEMLFYVSEDWHSSYAKHKSAQPEIAEMDYRTTESPLTKVTAFGSFL